jgi:hypothetical protein
MSTSFCNSLSWTPSVLTLASTNNPSDSTPLALDIYIDLYQLPHQLSSTRRHRKANPSPLMLTGRPIHFRFHARSAPPAHFERRRLHAPPHQRITTEHLTLINSASAPPLKPLNQVTCQLDLKTSPAGDLTLKPPCTHVKMTETLDSFKELKSVPGPSTGSTIEMEVGLFFPCPLHTFQH